MEQQGYANRKSRVVNFAADDTGPVWRAVGSVTIDSPELEEPLHLPGYRWIVTFRRDPYQGSLRHAVIRLKHLGRPPWQAFLKWTLLGALFGFAIARAYYTLALR